MATETMPDGTAVWHIYSGSVSQPCEASFNCCKHYESIALETERMAALQDQQQADPQNWSPLRRYVEAHKATKEMFSKPPEEIPEALVREALAQQYGIKPEEVSPEQIVFEVSGLLPHYPAIRVIPSKPSIPTLETPSLDMPEPQSPKQEARTETIGTQIDRLREECRWGLEELAEVVDLDPTNVSRHITDKTVPHLTNLRKYERVFSNALKRKVVINKTPRKRR